MVSVEYILRPWQHYISGYHFLAFKVQESGEYILKCWRGSSLRPWTGSGSNLIHSIVLPGPLVSHLALFLFLKSAIYCCSKKCLHLWTQKKDGFIENIIFFLPPFSQDDPKRRRKCISHKVSDGNLLVITKKETKYFIFTF